MGGFGVEGTQSARQKLGKRIHPNHSGRRRLTATMVPSSWDSRIQKLANMLRDKSMLYKLENIIVFIIYLLF